MRNLRRTDKILFIIVGILCIFGLFMIFSASSASTILRYEVSTSHFFIRQLIALIIGLLAGIVILFIPTKKYPFLSLLAAIAVLILLIGVLIKGKITGGAASWFKIGPLNLQPSEFSKIVLIMFLASFYGLISENGKIKYFVYLFPLIIPISFILFIIMEPDFGSAIILLIITIFTFLSVPYVIKNFKKFIKISIIPILMFACFIGFFGNRFFSEEQLSRFRFQNPCSRYTEDTGYQVCNGLIAISNGGLKGLGLGNSTQKYLYLPESHTDFIFPIICEELGSVVGSLVIILYLLLLIRIYKIAKEADNLRTSILAYGAFWYFFAHIFVNIFGILALIPLTGVPLPFLSYGGSYAMCSMIMIFIVERVAIENKINRLTRDMAKITN